MAELIWQFLKSFCKSGTISKGLSTSKMADFTFFFFFLILVKRDLLLRIFWLKWDPCLKIFGEKVAHLGGTSLYASTSE